MKISATERMRPWEGWGQSRGCRQGSAAGSGCAHSLRVAALGASEALGWQPRHTSTDSGGCVTGGRGAGAAQAAVACPSTEPAPCPRLPCPPGTCSPLWAGAAARLRAGCASRAPLRDGRASAVTQMCRWQPGVRQPPGSAGSALRAGRPSAVSSLPVAAGLVENDSTAVIGAITAGKSSPQRGIPWLPAHTVSATALSAPSPACGRSVSVGAARCTTHGGFQGSRDALRTAPGTPRGSSDLLWDARNGAR